MKIKKIVASIALVTLGSVSIALAGQGENTLNFTLTANVTKAISDDNVQIRVYNQGNVLPNASINANLKEALDTQGNLVWGSTGNFSGYADAPEINPENIYVVEVYSKHNTTVYQSLSTECQDISLQHGTDAQNVLTANCDRLHNNKTAYVGPKNQIPDALNQIVSAPAYFGPSVNTDYTMSSTPQAGDALYFAMAFFARLPNWGDDLSAYTPGNYTGSGSMIVRASWQ